MTDYTSAILLTIMMIAPTAVGIILRKRKIIDDKILCCLIILSGVILRLMYVTYTPITYRQHDVREFFTGNDGHAGYIEYIFNNHALPDFDPRTRWQFYHPPLHHIICAVWLSVLKLFGIEPMYAGVNSLNLLTVIYSSLFSFFAFRLYLKLDLKSTALYAATAITAFHPTLIILSGSINNDMLSALFAMLAIYYTVRWAQEQKISDIIKIALSIGLGMFTKLSAGLIAPAVAAVFLIVFIKNIKNFKKYIGQFALFAVICCPIGLFWSVRNYIKFGMPLNYVPLLSEDSGQFIDVSPLRRLTDWSFNQFASPFTQWEDMGHPYNEYNPFIALLKNSMFDELTYFNRSITLQSFCTALFFVNIIIIAFALFAMVMVIFKGKKMPLEVKALLGIVFLAVFGNYVVFCINYPHVCTQNTRYCVPLITVGAVFAGYFIQGAKDAENKKYGKIYAKSAKFLYGCTVCFALLSTFVYAVGLFYDISI